VQLPAVEPMIAASLLVLGLLVVTRVHLSAVVAMAVVGVFAVFHGVAHGYELASEDGAALTLAGMVCATVLLHAAGIAMGWALRHANAWLPRLAGAAVLGLGATLLAQAI
jgi:urease accessory protein